MIRLRRGPPPRLLETLGATWSARWQAIYNRTRKGDWATPATKKILAAELERLTNGKCAFCESMLDVSSYLEIEHYTAKTVDPGRAFAWENLFPICRRCNGAKGSIDHGGDLLKPDEDDPEDFLWLNPDSGKLELSAGLDGPTRHRVERTIEICKLQRGPLCTKRIEMMERVIHCDTAAEMTRLLHPATEYKFVIRHLLRTRGAPKLADEDRRRFEAF